jgi:hypothetical protein
MPLPFINHDRVVKFETEINRDLGALHGSGCQPAEPHIAIRNADPRTLRAFKHEQATHPVSGHPSRVDDGRR